MTRTSTRLERLTARVLSFFGLDLDFEIELRGALFDAITPDLYLGARPGPEHVAALKEAGVTHVVSCLSGDLRADMRFLEADFQTHFIPMHDGIHEDIESVFPEFFAFAHDARAGALAGKLLVHCQAGVSRSATLVTALRMHTEQLTFYDALCAVRAKRVEVLPNIGFATQLQRLEHALHPEAREVAGLSSLARYLHQICNVPVDVHVLQTMLERHDYDALQAIQATFGDEIPRVIQGVRV